MDVQLVVIVLIVVAIFLGVRAMLKASSAKLARMKREMEARTEALFVAGFPELQPHFHPKNVYEYAKARQGRKDRAAAFRWQNPAGFALASEADVQPDGARERTRLLDKAGGALAEFLFEDHAEGAAVRVGKGKFTVGLKSPEPRVRYWHPEREFKWTPTSWKMTSPLAEQALHSRTSRGGSSDDDGPDWSSSTGTFATGAAVGAGAAAAASAIGRGDSAPDFSGVESGSSSSATTY